MNPDAQRRFVFGVITVGVIRNGATYLSQHLRKNDYWAEGERQVQGEWIGQAAARLGLEGEVTERAFERLRRNQHPSTGQQLTPHPCKERVTFFDIQLSAPKDVSVLAALGGDDRIAAAFRESVRTAFAEMERFAAVRERRGRAHESEAFRLTGNVAGAIFFHDTSRDLDPQLHAHVVLANATWDAERGGWYALQPAEMLRASVYARQVLYREIAGRMRELGYEPYGLDTKGFAVRGAEHLRERFSKRTRQIQALADEFAQAKGRRPTKREVEVIVRESRSAKLARVSTPEVRRRQVAQLAAEERESLANLVRAAQAEGRREQASLGEARLVLDAALRHVYERRSVAREGEILSAALELHPDFLHWRELREALHHHPQVLRRNGEATLRPIYHEEMATIRRVASGRNTRFRLGKAGALPETLTSGQREAARSILASRDFAAVLVGDAGTGKTTVLRAIEKAHAADAGPAFLALAPTTRARDALAEAGFLGADTVQRFLASPAVQAQAAGRVILVDEAGLLSTQQLAGLTRIAESQGARLLLVGDTKQHYSVERGDALRNVARHSGTPVVRLSEVLRQRSDADRRFSRMLASGDAAEAFRYAMFRRMVQEAGSDAELFARAAEHYAENLARGIETLVVIPFWEEIDRFNAEARAALRRRGRLGEIEVVREAVRPLTWTAEQKSHWTLYRPGDRLLFVRDTRLHKRGSAAEVAQVLSDGLQVLGPGDRLVKIGSQHCSAFDVGRPQQLSLAAGDRILIRSRDDCQGFANGDFRTVARVDPVTGQVILTDGKLLPADFKAWTYGHALTSYRAQGSTAEESLLVLGEVAERALMRRQFYVGNTRFRGRHRIFVSHAGAILARLGQADPGRELAHEFARRQRLLPAERIALRPLQRFGQAARQIWSEVSQHWEEMREAIRERMGG